MLSTIHKMADKLSGHSSTILMFFFLISSNYIGDLFSCDIRRLLTKRWAIHLLAFITLYATLTASNPSNNMGHSLMMCTVLYFIFVAMTKGKLKFNMINIGLMAGIFMITKYMESEEIDTPEKERKLKTLKNMRTTGIVALIATCILSVATYYKSKKDKFGGKFDFLTFWIGKEGCKDL